MRFVQLFGVYGGVITVGQDDKTLVEGVRFWNSRRVEWLRCALLVPGAPDAWEDAASGCPFPMLRDDVDYLCILGSPDIDGS